MKILFTTLSLLLLMVSVNATDPIKRRTYFIEFDVQYSFYHHYNQAFFKKIGLSGGGAVSVGHHAIPLSIEYIYQLPLLFTYRNNEVRDQWQEVGLRYNLNHLTYLLPYGLDPYVGAGLMMRNNSFVQSAIQADEPRSILSEYRSTVTTYKLSSGVKMGNGNFVFGLHYDYLPKGFAIPNSEGSPIQIYNTLHLFSARIGIRLHAVPGNKIKCPTLNKRQKRTLAF